MAVPEHLAQAASPDPVHRRETRDQIAAAFQRLPLKLRVAATLALIEEQPYRDIAQALGTSEGTVRVEGLPGHPPVAGPAGTNGCDAMNEHEEDNVRQTLQAASPVTVELRRDLARHDAQARCSTTSGRLARALVLAGLVGGAVAVFPDLILVLVYHL